MKKIKDRLNKLLLLSLLGFLFPGQARAEPPGEDSTLIGCDRANEKLLIETSSHLDPSCVYTGGIKIKQSGVTLDCQGATIRKGENSWGNGILIISPVDVPLSNITVRNCHVEDFGSQVQRSGWKELEPGTEYDTPFSNIVFEDSSFRNSPGVGLFINAFVTDVTIQRSEFTGNGSTGLYLEAGSAHITLEDSLLQHNGFGPVDNDAFSFDLRNTQVNVTMTGREGLAIDGSRYNLIRGNTFIGNAAGGIFLYKNCGEYVHYETDKHWERLYGANENVIENNTLMDEIDGLWIGSRMAQNQRFMDCSDPAYISLPLLRIHLDYATDNTVRNNHFENNLNAIRIEDDGAVIEGNTFHSEDPAHQSVVLGTKFRTDSLGNPVHNATITNNFADMPNNTHPFVWIHGHEGTSFENNQANGVFVSLVPGRQPEMSYALFVDNISFER